MYDGKIEETVMSRVRYISIRTQSAEHKHVG